MSNLIEHINESEPEKYAIGFCVDLFDIIDKIGALCSLNSFIKIPNFISYINNFPRESPHNKY